MHLIKFGLKLCKKNPTSSKSFKFSTLKCTRKKHKSRQNRNKNTDKIYLKSNIFPQYSFHPFLRAVFWQPSKATCANTLKRNYTVKAQRNRCVVLFWKQMKKLFWQCAGKEKKYEEGNISLHYKIDIFVALLRDIKKKKKTYRTKNDITVKVKKSEKGINNQRNNLYYIKQHRKKTNTHTHTQVTTHLNSTEDIIA